MATDRICPNCGSSSSGLARFCAQCGSPVDGGESTVGRVPHPAPANVPDGFSPCEGAANLHYQKSAAWGGSRLVGTEGIGLTLFNAGYPLQNIVLRLVARGSDGKVVMTVDVPVPQCPSDEAIFVEVPSYEISEPFRDFDVVLVSADYGVRSS